MIDVEHRALRAFEHDALSAANLLVDPHRAVGDPMGHRLAMARIIFKDGGRVEGVLTVDSLEDGILLRAGELDLLSQDRRIEKIGNADSVADDLRLVRRSYSAPGRSDLRRAGRFF